ncbi:hypothetical protein ACEPPN_015311 [Leptodophora sp. 'Broadleaf-Isolate-01']
MRLLRLEDSGELSLVEFVGKNIPRYAILSHTWGADLEEVTFKDLINSTGSTKAGYRKVRFCTTQAAYDGLQFSWVDTCCIDKSSSAELSEAINCIFRWYHDAAKCYVYLPDVSISGPIENDLFPQLAWKSAFQLSRWFTRGWTLQELLAPISTEFFSLEGERLGNKDLMVQEIHEITGISVQALQGCPLSEFSIDERMLWAERRETTREEDAAYSLLGIFDVHMPLIYGEGRKRAFMRLRREIKESLMDESQSDHNSLEYQRSQKTREDKDSGLTSTKRPKAEKPQGFSDLETSAAIAGAATLGFAADQKLSQEQREQQPGSAQSIRSTSGVNSNRLGTPPLPPSYRKATYPRSLTQQTKPDLTKEAELTVITASSVNTANATINKGLVRAKDTASILDGLGEGRMGSPRPPAQPYSMRQRQDMQVLELENRVRQLAAENRMLVEFKAHAEQNLQKVVLEKDQEVAQLRAELNMAKEKIRGSSEDTARYSSGGGGGGGGWVAPEEEDETLQFLGEQELSLKLQECLEGLYVPEKHWTSVHRTKAGLPEFETTDGKYGAAFTIPDPTHIFAKILAQQYGLNPNNI